METTPHLYDEWTDEVVLEASTVVPIELLRVRTPDAVWLRVEQVDEKGDDELRSTLVAIRGPRRPSASSSSDTGAAISGVYASATTDVVRS